MKSTVTGDHRYIEWRMYDYRHSKMECDIHTPQCLPIMNVRLQTNKNGMWHYKIYVPIEVWYRGGSGPCSLLRLLFWFCTYHDQVGVGLETCHYSSLFHIQSLGHAPLMQISHCLLWIQLFGVLSASLPIISLFVLYMHYYILAWDAIHHIAEGFLCNNVLTGLTNNFYSVKYGWKVMFIPWRWHLNRCWNVGNFFFYISG